MEYAHLVIVLGLIVIREIGTNKTAHYHKYALTLSKSAQPAALK